MSTPADTSQKDAAAASASPPAVVEPGGFSSSTGLANGFAGREQILALDDRLFEEVDVPEWNTKVRVRGLTGSERDAWEASLVREDGSGRRRRMDYSNLRAKLIVLSVVDAGGNRVFEPTDTAALGRKSASSLERIFEVARRLSRLTDEDVEELTGNSKSESNAENGSGSLPISVSP
jgi:hypothetical protein